MENNVHANFPAYFQSFSIDCLVYGHMEIRPILLPLILMSKGSKILVTGGAGYIGSHTVVCLTDQGYEPVIVDNFCNSRESVIKGIGSISGQSPIVHRIDVCDKNALRSVFEEHHFVGVIHFAAYKAVGESVLNPLKYYENNIIGLLNCLELANEFKVESFVFSSSCTVYGEIAEGEKFVTESTPIGVPMSPYAATKILGEQMINDLHRAGSNIRFLKLRYFNPVGAHPTAEIGELPLGHPNNLLPAVVQVAVGKLKELFVNGNDYPTKDGTCIRDYIHVCDVAEAHVKGFEWLENQKDICCETVNIGRGEGTSVLEIIHTFEEISGRTLIWKFGPRRAGDIPEIYADVSKSHQLLNWQATRTVEDAVRDAWNWELRLENE